MGHEACMQGMKYAYKYFYVNLNEKKPMEVEKYNKTDPRNRL
jgi:hypothetical protein